MTTNESAILALLREKLVELRQALTVHGAGDASETKAYTEGVMLGLLIAIDIVRAQVRKESRGV